jgi:RNA polymerase sigma-70 factor (ECF subfamily)
MTEPQTIPAGEPPHGTVASATAGGAAAWAKDHVDAVYRYARKRLRAEDAEDVAQASFEALLRAEAEGRAPADPGAYLIGTARRRIADHYRRAARVAPPVALPPGWEAFCDRPLPPEALGARELRDLVHVALGLLRGPDREALLAHYRDGVPVAEIGERLGAGTKAAEMRLRRARETFRRRFEEVGRDWCDADAGGDPSGGTR